MFGDWRLAGQQPSAICHHPSSPLEGDWLRVEMRETREIRRLRGARPRFNGLSISAWRERGLPVGDRPDGDRCSLETGPACVTQCLRCGQQADGRRRLCSRPSARCTPPVSILVWGVLSPPPVDACVCRPIPGNGSGSGRRRRNGWRLHPPACRRRASGWLRRPPQDPSHIPEPTVDSPRPARSTGGPT